MNKLTALLVLFGLVACSSAGLLSNLIGRIGNSNEEPENFERPCGSGDIETECVRKFFEENGDGEVVTQTDDEPVLRERYVTYFPNVNVTGVDTNTLLRGLNGEVEDFYINKDTGNLVFTVFFQNASFETPEIIYYIATRGREPLAIADTLSATYPPVSITAILPLFDGRVTQQSFRDGTVTSFLMRALFPIRLGPNALREPRIYTVLGGVITGLPAFISEIFLTAGPGVFLAYLQKYISNFDISLTEPVLVAPLARPGRLLGN